MVRMYVINCNRSGEHLSRSNDLVDPKDSKTPGHYLLELGVAWSSGERGTHRYSSRELRPQNLFFLEVSEVSLNT